tara:strand:- start:885 stop:1136 length:252 start_codon:yes stop_codon:yes gene_type:complete
MVKLNNLKRDLRYFKRNYSKELKSNICKNYNTKFLNEKLDYFEKYSWDTYNNLNKVLTENKDLKEYSNYLEELFNVSNLTNNE